MKQIAALAVLALAACTSTPPAASIPDAPWRAVDPENIVLFDLGTGTVAIELFPEAAPAHAAQIRKLVRSGFYDTEFFYRVIEGHLAQAGREFDPAIGDVPNVPFEAERPVGTDGFAPHGNADLFAPEVGHRLGFAVGRSGGSEWLLNCPGVLGIARDADPASGATEIFIPLQPRRYLDRNYTVFGRVIDGMAHIHGLARVDPSTEEETAALFGDDAPLAHQIRQYRRSKLDPNMIISAKIAADLPADARPVYEVMATPGADWEALKLSKRDYSTIDAFIVTPPKILDICTLPVPARRVGE